MMIQLLDRYRDLTFYQMVRAVNNTLAILKNDLVYTQLEI